MQVMAFGPRPVSRGRDTRDGAGVCISAFDSPMCCSNANAERRPLRGGGCRVGSSPMAAASELASEVTVDVPTEVVLGSLEVVLGSLPLLARG
jgi:hypothetical protein